MARSARTNFTLDDAMAVIHSAQALLLELRGNASFPFTQRSVWSGWTPGRVAVFRRW